MLPRFFVLGLVLLATGATTFAQQLTLRPGERIALIGNSLFDRMRDDGQFEALLHQRFPNHHLIVRNLAWSADEVALRPRPDGFGDLNQHLTEHQTDVILAAFGFNESFKGKEGVAEFETLLKAFLIELKSHRYNGKSAPRIVLVSPTAAEKPHENLNGQMQPYVEAMRTVAKTEGVEFADVFAPTLETFTKPRIRSSPEAAKEKPQTANSEPGTDIYTINGVHLNTAGYRVVSEDLFRALFEETAPRLNEAVRAAVVEKETKFFQYYRPLNYYYIKGGRAEPYGVVNFPGELEKLKQMVGNRDKVIWQRATSTDYTDSADRDKAPKDNAPTAKSAAPDKERKSSTDHADSADRDKAPKDNSPTAKSAAPDKERKSSTGYTDSADRDKAPKDNSQSVQSAKSVDLHSASSVVVDDSNTPELPRITGDRPINEWLSPAEELKAFKIDPLFEVNCFASEEDFPDLFKKPIQIRWDTKGRLWVSTSVTYPQILPGDEPQDKILILEDTNHDGKADKCSVWADKLHIPLSFEFGNGGVFVSDQPNLTFLKDTDGDGKADFRQKVLTGFGTEDSHHALHDFVWSPEGDLIFRESIFHHSQVETPYGPVRARESSFFRYTPGTGKLLAFGSYLSTNPWGITFDDWGFHVGSHPVFASAVHALNAPYPDIHIPAGNYMPAYSGTCGQEFLSSNHWPDDLRNKKHFMRVRYKPTNEVELHEWEEFDTHFEEKKVAIVFQSTNLSFIPVDINQGPDGAMYVADWYNPVKGHMQYSLRDTRRDKKSGRIWRITAKGRPLEEAPKIADASIPELLELLKSENYRTRYRAKVELREKGTLPSGTPTTTQQALEFHWLGLTAKSDESDRSDLSDAKVRAGMARSLRWHPNLNALRKSANDPSGLVRLEAAISASYIGTPEALEAALDLLKHPMDSYLTYALRTTVDSHTLKPLWHNNKEFMDKHPAFAKFLQDSEPKKPAQMAKKKKAEPVNPFDLDPAIQVVHIKTIPERLLYDVREFRVKPGAPVRLTFENPDVTPHNLLIVQPGAADEVGMAGNEMAKLTDGMAKQFIPESPKILHRIRLLMQGESETLRFKAPATPGHYPYICTFPGHWLVMKGEMIVE